jgi:16S rRNA U1498 N3-methylase RsmE
VRAADVEARFCLWENATEPLGPALFAALTAQMALAFACGPEGGLDETEVALASAQGWTVASLGPLALRTGPLPRPCSGGSGVGRDAGPAHS